MSHISIAASIATLTAAVTLAVACTSTPAATPGPSIAVPSIPSGSFVIPSFVIPSFAADTELEALFPATIDGEPVEGVSSASFLAVLQAFADSAEDQAQIAAFISGMQSIGVDPGRVAFASGQATVNDQSVQIQALRTPGGSAAAAIDILVQIDAPEEPPTLTTATLGGKNVTVATTSDGDVDYYYVNGEIAWFLSSVETEEAEIILAALP